jgi:maltose alpha-D-glucosyltransferase/alpha-amylase
MLVFGDEIGLGENLAIPGRDAARTPMQWSPGRNGGFSSADPEQLAAPVNWNGDYSYERVNVLNQLGDPSSTLEAVRRFAAARREMVEIGRGGWAMLPNTCPHVLVYQCVWRSVTSLFIFNLSREEQSDLVDLSDHRGEQLVPVISKVDDLEQYQTKRFRITLPPYGYAWYRSVEEEGL